MDDLIGALAVTLIFGGGTAFLLAISPIGRALADRIRNRTQLERDERLRALFDGHEAMMDEMDTMRTEVADLQERLDFTERLLTRGRGDQGLDSVDDVKK